MIGNGGLHYVASHMATDLSRLVSHLSVHSFDSVGFITSNANDHGYDNIFTRWLETINFANENTSPIVIGLSCSGRSINVINALELAIKNNSKAYLISGVENKNLKQGIKQLNFDCKYYHTVEALCLMLFYHIVHSIGYKCPPIR